jgi:membrane protein
MRRGEGDGGNNPNVGSRAKNRTPVRWMTSAAARTSKRMAKQKRRLQALLPASVHRFLTEAHEHDLFLLSAGLAFYALISVAPLVILVMWITSVVLGDERIHQLAAEVGRYAPKGIGADQALRRVSQMGSRIGWWAIVTALWPATAYGAGLRRAFDRLSPKEEPLEGLRGRGLAFLVLIPVFVLGSLISAYAGSRALGEGTAARIAGIAVALVACFATAAAAIILVYRIFPPGPMTWRKIRRGAAIAAGGIALLSVAYVVFLSSGTNFEQHYLTSGLAGVVLLGVWLFMANVMLLVGYKAVQS